ncbi:sulfurtransferase complex subunit TusB [Candidatus Vondammii sp. HM_W22]|uniref:sulfurtransferase complex subunit TusB n=1 Tax=Candidatus Vondammii sp. HM_W22 TaxID=2687299 RepID=UPI001F12D10E|nr:sulfurtransferase complex subunit TusB [Candidatus Vondammii sp. HM_W22]
MSELHTVNKSPFEKNSFDSCLGHALEGSAVLLFEDGVYAVMKGTVVEEKVKSAQGVKFYALGPDMKARGLPEERLIDGVEVVDYAGFVDLAAEYGKVVPWV